MVERPMLETPVVLVIDGNNLMAIQTHTHLALTAPDGEPSGGVYGVVQKVRRMILMDIGLPVSEVVFVRDAGRPKFRSRCVPTYKTGREDARSSRDDGDDFYEKYRHQSGTVGPVLLSLGVHVAHADGYEADDTIAGLVNHRYAGRSCVVVSTDKDLLQLVRRRRVHVYRPVSDEMVSKIPPGYLLARAIQGDKSDNIPNIPQLGEKRVAEIIAEMGSMGLDFTPDALLSGYRGKWWDKGYFKGREDQLRNNWRVMNLRRTARKAHARTTFNKGRYSREEFVSHCKRYAFRSILADGKQWRRPFVDMKGAGHD